MKPLLVASLVLLGLGLASAQVFSDLDFTAPSSFVVGNATLPAGKYVIRLSDDPSLMEIANESGSISVLFEVEPLDTVMAAKSTEIEFNKYGSKLVLKSIRIQGTSSGAMSSTEMAERRHMKLGKATKVVVPASIRKD
jgi:hypothetical protein